MVDVFDGVDNDALMIDDCNGESLSYSAYCEKLFGTLALPLRRTKPWPSACFASIDGQGGGIHTHS